MNGVEQYWNPYFVAYAQTQGRTPAAQSRHDREENPGACNLGFMMWISERREVFRRLHPEAFTGGGRSSLDTISDHVLWAKFLHGGA